MKYDFLIVGSGLFGAVFAHRVIQFGKRVLVIDQRSHIGGNCYTKQVDDIQIHQYGPHIFHTNNDKIWQYVNQLASFNNFIYRPKVNYQNRIFSFPINLFTLYQLWDVKTPEQAAKKLAEVAVPIEHPANLEEWLLSKVGEEIYQTFFYGYTKKQWRKDPRELPASIVKRLPIRFNFDDNYYNHKYQGIPIGGYTQIFDKLLYGIEVKLNCPLEKNWQSIAHKLVYTGRPETLLDYKYGELEYLTLEFDHKKELGDHQGVAAINYTHESVPYTRKIEHKHFEFGTQNNSIVTYEHPVDWTPGAIPYYPINTEKNNVLYDRYKQEINKQNVILGGRLGRYQYMDMDQVIANALNEADKQCGLQVDEV